MQTLLSICSDLCSQELLQLLKALLHICCSLYIFFVTVRQQETFNSVIEAVPFPWFSEKELLGFKKAQGVSGVTVFGGLCQVSVYDSNCASHP